MIRVQQDRSFFSCLVLGIGCHGNMSCPLPVFLSSCLKNRAGEQEGKMPGDKLYSWACKQQKSHNCLVPRQLKTLYKLVWTAFLQRSSTCSCLDFFLSYAQAFLEYHWYLLVFFRRLLCWALPLSWRLLRLQLGEKTGNNNKTHAYVVSVPGFDKPRTLLTPFMSKGRRGLNKNSSKP